MAEAKKLIRVDEYSFNAKCGQALNIYLEIVKIGRPDILTELTAKEMDKEKVKEMQDDIELITKRLVKISHNIKNRARNNWKEDGIEVI